MSKVGKKYRDEAKLIPWRKLPGAVPSAAREVAFAFDGRARTARVIWTKPDGHRDYGELLGHEVPGTADVVVPGFRTVEVYDYKTGRPPPGPPSQNPQLLHLATMARRTMAPSASHALVGIVHLHFKGEKCIPRNQVSIIDRWTLDDHEDRLERCLDEAERVKLKILKDEEPPVNPGNWCRFCPAKPSCPVMKDK